MPESTDAAIDIGAEEAKATIAESMERIVRDFLEALPLLVIGLVVLLLTWLLSALSIAILRRVLARTRLRGSLKDLIVQLCHTGLWIAGFLLAAMVAFPGVTPARILTVLGLGSIAIGFAFKDIFENFFAGVLILWHFPFESGDFIEVTGITGRVETITLRMTEIRQVDGQLVVVPNAHVFKNPVTVITSQPLRRTTITAGVALSEDVDKAREVIRTAVENCQTVSKEREVQIFAQAFAPSSIEFEVTWWTGSKPVDIRRSRDEVVAAVKRSLEQAGIEIPFPYLTLAFKEPLRMLPAEREQAETPGRPGPSA